MGIPVYIPFAIAGSCPSAAVSQVHFLISNGCGFKRRGSSRSMQRYFHKLGLFSSSGALA